jgi:hypothetical protein
MFTSEIEIDRLATAMIARYGVVAAREAVMRLNQMIDRGDLAGRDRWACVVRSIHECQGLAPVFSHGVRNDTAPPAVRSA